MAAVPNENTYVSEVKRLEGEGRQFALQMRPIEATSLIGAIQLVLRHPGFRGPSSQVVRDLAIALQQGIASASPALGDQLQLGWDPAHDVAPDPRPDQEMADIETIEGVGAIYVGEGNTETPDWAEFSRPQDFAINPWTYRRLSYEVGRRRYICHAYINVPTSPQEMLARFLPIALQMPLPTPGQPKRPMAPTDCLQDTDFWSRRLGPPPPPCEQEEDYGYDFDFDEG
jgi:hypothetical protein